MITVPNTYTNQKQLVLYKALASIGVRDDLEAFKNWVLDEINRLDKANRSEADEITLRQRQGSLMALENIVSNIEAADENFKKLLKCKPSAEWFSGRS